MASSSQLRPDLLRTVLAGIIAALLFGGWAYVIVRPEMRASLRAQPSLWWIEQIVLAMQAAACVGVLVGFRRAFSLAAALTALALLSGAVHWVQALGNGRLSLPAVLVLNALLLWRLLLARSSRSISVNATAD